MKSIEKEEKEQFIKSVLDRYESITQLHIYPIEQYKIEAWINNFTSLDCRYIAAQILDKLIYRSNKMAKESFHSFLVSVFRDYYFNCLNKEPDPISKWQCQLNKKWSNYSNTLVIAPVRLPKDSGASADTVCRMIEVNSSFTKYLTKDGFGGEDNENELPRDKVILLVDDMLGSGEQIIDFSTKVNLQGWSENNYLIYAPLIAFEIGLKTARESLPFLKITPIEILEKDQRFFSFEENANFIGSEGVKESDAIECYRQMLSDSKLPKNLLFGRDDSALALAFEWGCPNQTLAALWYVAHDQSINWSNLFRRRE
jgi:hypothetical protein